MLLIILFGREGVDSTGLNIHRMLESFLVNCKVMPLLEFPMNLDLFTVYLFIVIFMDVRKKREKLFYFRRGLDGNYYIKSAIFVLVNLMLLLMNFIRF